MNRSKCNNFLRRAFILFRSFIIRFGAKLLGKGTPQLLPSIIFAPHPDDECFGCGQMIAALKRNGIPLLVVIATNGEAAHRECEHSAEDVAKARRQDAQKALFKLAGIMPSEILFLDLPDGDLEHALRRSESQGIFTSILRDNLDKQRIFLPHAWDCMSDHVALSHFLRTVAPERQIMQYCTWMYCYLPLRSILRLDFKNAYTIRGYDMVKRDAISVYTSHLAPCGEPYVCKLPDTFLKATISNVEVYFQK